jgi:hypothetical protein
VLLALLLGLGLRGKDKPKPAVVAELDANAELVVAQTAPDEVRVVVPVPIERPVDASPDLTIAAPKQTPKKPTASAPTAAPSVVPPSAAEVARLYGALGRELKALDAKKGMDATIELWPRYRWIRINEWITTPERRAQIARELERLRVDIKAAYDS